MSGLTYTRADHLVAALTPPDHAYAVKDAAGALVAVVAGSGRSWTAGRVMPSRTYPFGRPERMGRGVTREAAVLSLKGGA